jgi:transcriptional regulator with AAA-type ATPase domain/transposase
MQAIKAYIAKVASTESHVLITGETGTGKELLAEQIHRQSRRSQQPFVCINCTAVPDSLLESELFGYERGAFTGAGALNRGAFEQAEGGTLFLDEIGDMSPHAQAKILRAVEGKEVRRLGGQRSIPLDIRVVAATNQDLEQLVAAGQFRKDLYFRLNVARIHLPPLRDRKQDLGPLCEYYIQVLNEQLGREVESLTADVLSCLLRYDWPGNVRELKNLLEAIFINVPSRTIAFMDLPEPFRRRLKGAAGFPLAERDLLLSALFSTRGNKSKAAQQLHWSRMTLYRKLREYQITVPRERHPQSTLINSRVRSAGNALPGTPLQTRIAMRTDNPSTRVPWELPDALWQRMEALIPPRKSREGHPRIANLRRITEGIFYVLRTRTPWHTCPREHFGPPSTVYYYFTQWVRAGVFDQLWAEALAMYNDLQGREWTWRLRNRTRTTAIGEERS